MVRINHWDFSQGRRLRLFCTLFSRIGLVSHPSISQLGAIPSVPAFRSLRTTTSVPQFVPPPPPQPASPCPPPHRCQGCQELILLVRRLTLQLEALQTEVHRMARQLSTSFSPSTPFSLTPCFHTVWGPPPVVQCWPFPCTSLCHSTSLPHPALFSSWLHFACTPVLLHGTLTLIGHSHRCPQHHPSVPQPPGGSSRPACPPHTCLVHDPFSLSGNGQGAAHR